MPPPTEEQLLLGVAADEQPAPAGATPSPPPTCQALQPCRLVDLVRPGPSGTVSSTAAAAAAAHAPLLRARPDVAPAGLLAATAAATGGGEPVARPLGSVMQDLLRAAEKALASGLGEWHLQSVQDVSPLFQRHVLMGALGPEALKRKHQLPEPQILHLYGLLHRHATGFQAELASALDGAEQRDALLPAVWVAFAQLWDECVRGAFPGEVLAGIRELQAMHAALLDCQDALGACEAENAALKQRCSEFVRANLDHMLAWRSLKARTDALEGEAAMLSAANSEVTLRSAATAARNTQLTVQLEGVGARLAGAEQQIAEREAALAAARAALLEKDSGLRRLEAQVAALEQQLLAAGQGARRQDGVISELQRQLEARGQQVQDAERRVLDKQRAFNLLHADFAKQKAEAAEALEAAAQASKRLGAVQQQLAASHVLAAKARGWQRRWEVTQMQVEDLAACNTRAMVRRQELVAAYWPVMERLGAAEDAAAALTQQLLELGQQPAVQLEPRDCRAQDVAAAALARQPAASGTGSDCSQPDQQPAPQPPHLQQPRAELACGVGSQGQTAAGGLPGVEAAVREELQQLRDCLLLLQKECLAQKERVLSLELEAGQLRATAAQATAGAAQADAALAEAQQDAAQHAGVRARLEADLVGCRSWIRGLEKTEQAYLATIREQAALEHAAIVAQRQAQDRSSALAEAQAKRQLAEAQAAALGEERRQLLLQLRQELNRSRLVEQALQRVHKQEVSSSRAACAQLRDQLDQQAAEFAAARAQLAEARLQAAAALAEQQQLRLQLQQSADGSERLGTQLRQAQTCLMGVLQRLEALEARVSYLNAASVTSLAPPSDGRCLEVAVEGAVHLLERLLVALQCLAADAGAIANAAAAARVEALVGLLMGGLEAAAAAAAAAGSGSSGQGPGVAAPTGLVVLRNAAAAAGRQRAQALEQQASMLQLQLADSAAQLADAASSGARLQRALQLKTRAVASLERQLAAADSQLQQLAGAQAAAEASAAQLHAEAGAARLEQARQAAAATAQSSELCAAQGRAAAAETALAQLQAAAEAEVEVRLALAEQLAAAAEASRAHALAAAAAQGEAAAAAAQAAQLGGQLAAAHERLAQLGSEARAARHQADAALQAARDAQYERVATQSALADARRALDFSQHLAEAAAAGAAAAAPQPCAAPPS